MRIIVASVGPPALRRVDPHRPRGPLYGAVCRLSVTSVGMWLSRKIAWRLDPVLLKLTRGHFSSTGPVVSAVLETRGARTGQLRRTATLYFHDGDRVILVAAKQGAATQPGWYHNLCKHPAVVFGGLPFRAEIVEDDAERRRLWELAIRVFPQYEDFRKWAQAEGRQIPIIQLVRR